MPDLLASTSLLPLTPAIAPRTAAIAAPAVADFMAMLGELVLPPGARPQGGKGQALAGDGKNLPVEGAPAAGDEDEADPLVAWLPAGLVPLALPDPVSLPDAAFVAATPSAGIEAAVAAPIADAVPSVGLPAASEIPAPLTGGQAGVATAEAVPADVGSSVVDPVPVEAAPVEAKITSPQAPEAAPRTKAEAPVREAMLRAAPVHAATPQPVIPGATAAPTAAQVFAAAISASFDSPAGPTLRTADPVAVQAQAAAASEQLRTTVQAMSGAEQPPLDLSRDDWAGKMVDRIAAMRDAAEAADTRIRLAPENLGNVDVSIRRDGDRLLVHFTAENPATRQMLAEAAPRLAELADARGVKLGQTSVDAGTGGQQGQSGQPHPNQPARPASAAANLSQSDRDGRVA
ncbi:flagellar hook-length control protein FliK [Sphingomonas koreensis]